MSLSSRSAVALAAGGLVTFTTLTITLLGMGMDPTRIDPLILSIVVGVNHLLQSASTTLHEEKLRSAEMNVVAPEALPDKPPKIGIKSTEGSTFSAPKATAEAQLESREESNDTPVEH
ncbi:hypothetical protein [Streptomyces sp. NPDC087859]|uniref:hypothetical protein n=1 Tax=Streptomyces sp. NPDC087859 TaxID=3365812 RepID=UPI00380BC458